MTLSWVEVPSKIWVVGMVGWGSEWDRLAERLGRGVCLLPEEMGGAQQTYPLQIVPSALFCNALFVGGWGDRNRFFLGAIAGKNPVDLEI